MGILDWFASGPKAAEKVLDASIRGVDALVYTDEEKAVAKQKVLESWLKLQETMGEETTVRAVTRRILAVMIMSPFVGMAVGAAVAYKFDKDYANFLYDMAEGSFGTMAIMVAVFYFGPYMLGQAAQAFRKPPQLNGNGNGK